MLLLTYARSVFRIRKDSIVGTTHVKATGALYKSYSLHNAWAEVW